MKESTNPFDQLVELMDRLRSPGGCPWDLEQTRETLKPMLIEEAYEVLEALDSPNPDELCEELGDLLFQIIFQSRIAKEREEFDAYDVCKRVYEKMVRRHPHVFGEAFFEDAQDLLRNWEELKAAEKAENGKTDDRESLLDGIPKKMPTLYRTHQMTAKAARVGFDWPHLEALREKLLEEFDEVLQAREEGRAEELQKEVGDFLFTALNVARKLEIDPETALRQSNAKFERRFREMERTLAEKGRSLKEASLEEMDKVWQAQKTTPVAGGE